MAKTSVLYLDCTTVIEASTTNVEIDKHKDRSRDAYYVYKYMVCVEFNHACHAHSSPITVRLFSRPKCGKNYFFCESAV